ncbi:molybdopterin-dependent oxidoreductase [candidate division WOR-3 bacterium]|uniref:Molybdopterin-dependent oxidoreductase n=1 Tax=candidate division WOR-3 bacterium TaxID=2052148 RepID=A0A9D5QEE0_UNCW3|nr:molybdopterin-dependent oxidoreductase [candidate division WOR-3 bacterium]MBD3364950.1 molybdopterin-dependent oxidoreductase [candidate division WOR-3 bacterium]
MNIEKIIVSLFAVAGLFSAACGKSVDATTKATGMKDETYPGEIMVYEGVNLSSITGFRENSIKGTQKVDTSDYRLEITGLVDTALSYTYGEVLGNFTSCEKVIRMKCVEGWALKLLWEGVKVTDLLASAGVSESAKTVIFHSTDGYTTSLPLSYVKEKDLLLAFKINGIVLPPRQGFPFMLAAEGKWGYKWARWVERIELSADTTYKGFWETRGYSNDASEDKPFFDRP